jgi:formylglycine-generating enzyme required for sulfatase activity
MKRAVKFLGILSAVAGMIILSTSCGSSPDQIKPGKTDLNSTYPEPLEIEWVEIPAGEFSMGSEEGKTDEQPVHTVYLDTYFISKHEVNFAQYDQFCEETGREKPEDSGWGRGNRPVINVTWQDAVDYCRWLTEKTGESISLPTEAQWEKASRGTDQRIYPWGSDPVSGIRANFADARSDLAWKDKRIDDKHQFTAPVDAYSRGASPYGILNMGGNVWEWCTDWYGKYYYGQSPGRNPAGPDKGFYRIGRGGSWRYSAEFLRCASRNFFYPDFGYSFVGFRLVKAGRKE